MKDPYHKLLARQIKKHLGDTSNLSKEFTALINDINNTYNYYDDDILLLQNSVEISSNELRQAFNQQKADAEEQKRIIEKINEIISAIKPSNRSEFSKDQQYNTNQLLSNLLELIEERKKSEELIMKLSFAVEQNPASVVITDLDGNIEYVNAKFCELTGYTQEEVIGETPAILKSGHTTPEEYKEMWNTILAGKEWRGEFLNKKKNGKLYWEKALLSPVKNQQGITINYLALKEDITEQKATEEKLENQRTLFRTIIDLIPDAVSVKDLKGRKILSNPKDVYFAGKVSEEDVLGKTDHELYPEEQANKSDLEERKVISSGIPVLNNEGVLIDHENNKHSVLISKVPLYDVQGKITGIVGVTNDVSVIKQAELELQHAHKSLEDVLNAAIHTSIIATDSNGIITIFSHGAEKMLGYKAEEMIGVHTPRIIHMESEVIERGVELSEEYGQQIEGFEVFVHKTRHEQHEERNWTYVRKDGSSLSVNLIVTAIRNVADEITGFLGIAHDITYQKQYEKKLLKARRAAENANRAKSEFLANVSHEIRTPMNAIVGFAEILIDKLDEPVHKDHVKTILSSGRTLLSLINDILDLSKIEAGKLDIEYEPVSFIEILRDIKQVFMPKVKLKSLDFNLNITQDTPELIYMDQVRLNQILFNLVGNAIKFTESGHVQINTKVEPCAQQGYINLSIEIEDTGIGIHADQITPIFEAFTQQSGQSNRKYEGTGLGLAISKRLVEKMNGSISVKSHIGKGSVFSVNFKNVKLAESSDLVDKETAFDTSSIRFEHARIMVVDDIRFNIQILKAMLEPFDFDFIEASSGEEALDTLKTEIPDLIFMDFRMPGMNGIVTTEQIKKKQHLKHIPVVAFTASAMPSQIDEVKELFDGYIRKPVDKKTLIQELKKYLPYAVEKSVDEIKMDYINLDELCNLTPELLNEIDTVLIPQWENISGSLIIFEIEEFCMLLENTCKRYRCMLFPNYTTQLRKALQTLDIDNINKTLAAFGNMIESVKKENN